MPNKYHFEDHHIVLDNKPRSFKKMTATRFAAVLGLNAWNTPFTTWCAITRTWEQPFEDSIYTIAGKTIEPKIQEYCDKRLFMNVTRPEDIYGKDFFHKTWGDFFHDTKIFGGMWDALGKDEETGEDFVIEIKTTKRAEDWEDGVPPYYKLQAALYTYLLGLDKFVVPVSFLEPSDYDNPDAFVPSYENTKVFEFSLAEEYPNFVEDYIRPAKDFWEKHVMTGISPNYDERRDSEPLKALRKNTIKPTDNNLQTLLDKAEALKSKIDKNAVEMAETNSEYKEVQAGLKDYMKSQFREGDDHVEVKGKHINFILGKSVRTTVDSKKLKADDLYDQYSKQSETYTLKTKEAE